jgi:hypothetical protein
MPWFSHPLGPSHCFTVALRHTKTLCLRVLCVCVMCQCVSVCVSVSVRG